MESVVKQHFQSELAQIDWNFSSHNGTSGLASVHWYPARFIPQIPSILIGYFSEPGETICDPFMGCGTTLVEAVRLNRKAVGIDLHPVAALIARANLTPTSLESVKPELESMMNKSEQLASQWIGRQRNGQLYSELRAMVPNYEENLKWYHPDTLIELASIYSATNFEPFDSASDIWFTCFSAILLWASSNNRHYGWVCDNVRPRELIYKPAFKRFRERLQKYYKARQEFEIDLRNSGSELKGLANVEVNCGDALRELAKMEDSSVHFIITSPPYLGVTDYIDAQRLSILWFRDINMVELRKKELGARFKRFRKKPAEEYISAISECLRELKRVLIPGRYMCLVLGESSSRARYVSNIISICEELGFSIVADMDRTIPMHRNLRPSILEETILIFKNQF